MACVAVAAATGPAWPFNLGYSPLISPLGASSELIRLVGMALVAVTGAGFTVAALSALGVAPDALWVPAVLIGSTASIGVLGLFFHPWLILGIGIDIALIWAVTLGGWQPA